MLCTTKTNNIKAKYLMSTYLVERNVLLVLSSLSLSLSAHLPVCHPRLRRRKSQLCKCQRKQRLSVLHWRKYWLLFIKGHTQLGSRWKVIDLTVCTTPLTAQTGVVQDKDSTVTLTIVCLTTNLQSKEYILSNQNHLENTYFKLLV